MAGVREGRFRLLYVSPERLVGEGADVFLGRVASGAAPVRFVAIDEAHCISQWGHDFRPEYRQLGRLRDLFPGASLHAFTATATGRVRRDIVAQLGLRDPLELVGSFDRPNLTLPRPAAHRAEEADPRRRLAGTAATPASSTASRARRSISSPPGCRRRACGRCRTTPGSPTTSGTATRTPSSTSTPTSSSPPSPSAWASTARTCATCCTPARRSRSSTTSRSRAAPAATGSRPNACWWCRRADFLKWRQMLERNGELTEQRRTLLRDIERYAASVGCRHRHLVRYFGEAFAKDDCGACDYCLGELEAVAEPVTVARQVLSCVARVGQRFGAGHVTSVLRGTVTENVTARGHDTLTTFGLLRAASIDEVRGYIDQLLAHGLLRQTDDQYPVLALTDDGVALLKDAGAAPDLALARQRRPDPARSARRSKAETEGWDGVDRDLFERLRALRLQVARSRGVPPYVVFHDTTLRELARAKPRHHRRPAPRLRRRRPQGRRPRARAGDGPR